MQLAQLRSSYQTYGLRATAFDISCRAANKFGTARFLKGMTVRMKDVPDRSLFESPGFDGRFVGANELERYADGSLEFTPAFLREASARGDRCYALFDGNILASHGWYSNQPTEVDDGLMLHFDPRYTYMYKGFTAPAYRGKRLHAVGMCRALQAVTEEGKVGLISWVYSNNFASLRSTKRMGYDIFGTACAIGLGDRLLTYETPGCRAYGFRLEKPASR
jgi:hypothetical protein